MTRPKFIYLQYLHFPMIWLGAHLSFTRFIIDCLKNREGKKRTGELLFRWNWIWFIWEVLLAIAFTSFSLNRPVHQWDTQMLYLFCIFAFWRINEVSYAFYNDAISKLRGQTANSNLPLHRRVGMLIRSFIGVIVQFAILYYCLLPSQGFTKRLCDFRDALYFSATTLTGIGQEGQEVTGHWLRLLHVYESVVGILLLVLALSIYIGSNQSGPRTRGPNRFKEG